MNSFIETMIRQSPYLTKVYQDDAIFATACKQCTGPLHLLEFMVRSHRMAWSQVEELHRVGLPPMIIQLQESALTGKDKP